MPISSISVVERAFGSLYELPTAQIQSQKLIRPVLAGSAAHVCCQTPWCQLMSPQAERGSVDFVLSSQSSSDSFCLHHSFGSEISKWKHKHKNNPRSHCSVYTSISRWKSCSHIIFPHSEWLGTSNLHHALWKYACMAHKTHQPCKYWCDILNGCVIFNDKSGIKSTNSVRKVKKKKLKITTEWY